MASFFRSHGYEARCNEILEGRSGGRHEVDVLAEKTDALTTFRVAVECKAWQQPIEKDVVSKLHYVLGDLGLNKGIVVSLGGCRSGAERTASDLGIELWGPEELRRHLGETAAAVLNVSPSSSDNTLAWGHSVTTTPEVAEAIIRSAGKGRMSLRTLEEVQWFSLLWVPAYAVRLSVAQPATKRRKTRLQSATIDNVYEALGGSFIGRAQAAWEQIEVDSRLSLPAAVRDTRVHSELRKALKGYEKVASPSAVQRHAANLLHLGVPTPCSSLSIEQTSLVHLPYWTGILSTRRQQRVVAVAGRSGQISDPISRVLTANLSQIRAKFAG